MSAPKQNVEFHVDHGQLDPNDPRDLGSCFVSVPHAGPSGSVAIVPARARYVEEGLDKGGIESMANDGGWEIVEGSDPATVVCRKDNIELIFDVNHRNAESYMDHPQFGRTQLFRRQLFQMSQIKDIFDKPQGPQHNCRVNNPTTGESEWASVPLAIHEKLEQQKKSAT